MARIYISPLEEVTEDGRTFWRPVVAKYGVSSFCKVISLEGFQVVFCDIANETGAIADKQNIAFDPLDIDKVLTSTARTKINGFLSSKNISGINENTPKKIIQKLGEQVDPDFNLKDWNL